MSDHKEPYVREQHDNLYSFITLEELERQQTPSPKTSTLNGVVSSIEEVPPRRFLETIAKQHSTDVNIVPIKCDKEYFSLITEFINIIYGGGYYSLSANATNVSWDAESFCGVKITEVFDTKEKQKIEACRESWYGAKGAGSIPTVSGRKIQKRLLKSALYEHIAYGYKGERLNISDYELVQRIKQGDSKAIAQFYYRMFTSVFDWLKATNRAMCDDDAEEITELTLTWAIDRMHTFEHRSKLKTWVHQIAKSQSASFYRVKRNKYDTFNRNMVQYEENGGADFWVQGNYGTGLTSLELVNLPSGMRASEGGVAHFISEADIMQVEKSFLPPMPVSHFPNALNRLLNAERRRRVRLRIGNLTISYQQLIRRRFFSGEIRADRFYPEARFRVIAQPLNLPSENAAELLWLDAKEEFKKLLRKDPYFEELFWKVRKGRLTDHDAHRRSFSHGYESYRRRLEEIVQAFIWELAEEVLDGFGC